MARRFRPGDHARHCGVHGVVSSIYRGEAEFCTINGVLIDYVPVGALHYIPREHDEREIEEVNMQEYSRWKANK